MNTDADLKAIQRKVYLSYFQDGLWDMLLGIVLIGWGLMLWYDFVAVMGGVCVAFYFLILGLKRWLVCPRAGYIKIAEARKQQVKMVILGVMLFLAGLAAFFIFAVETRPYWLSDYFMFIFGTMLAVVIGVLGYWWKVARWYVYAVIVFASFSLYQWLNTPLNLTFIVPGGIIAVYGFTLLVVFLCKFPRVDAEDMNAGS
jgi:hypothetical protein